MNHFLLLLATLSTVTALNSFPKLFNITTFADFVAQSGRIYRSIEEHDRRARIFLRNKRMIDESNQKGLPYTLEINALCDMEPAEVGRLMGRVRLTGMEKNLSKNRKKIDEAKFEGIPSSFDWRKAGAVTPVKFQGSECGSCWAYVATGAIEGHWFVKTGNLTVLSEQNLIDCSAGFGNSGCDGGFQDYAFEYVTQNYGIASDNAYPTYSTQRSANCQYSDEQKGATIIGYAVIDNEELMKDIVATLGPVACSMNARQETFTFYSSGLYRDDECNNYDDFNHSVLVVGYGREDGQDFWIVKNSWSANWGDGGYMKLPRNLNYCGIGLECSYPIV